MSSSGLGACSCSYACTSYVRGRPARAGAPACAPGGTAWQQSQPVRAMDMRTEDLFESYRDHVPWDTAKEDNRRARRMVGACRPHGGAQTIAHAPGCNQNRALHIAAPVRWVLEARSGGALLHCSGTHAHGRRCQWQLCAGSVCDMCCVSDVCLLHAAGRVSDCAVLALYVQMFGHDDWKRHRRYIRPLFG
jgi:hypothetical protein